MADPEGILELATKFERAFTEFSRLQDEGKLDKVDALSSKATIEAIRRINELIKLGLDNPQTFQHASEIHRLAEQWLETLKSDPATAAAIRARDHPRPGLLEQKSCPFEFEYEGRYAAQNDAPSTLRHSGLTCCFGAVV